jgi:hypothetical protein
MPAGQMFGSPNYQNNQNKMDHPPTHTKKAKWTGCVAQAVEHLLCKCLEPQVQTPVPQKKVLIKIRINRTIKIKMKCITPGDTVQQ